MIALLNNIKIAITIINVFNSKFNNGNCELFLLISRKTDNFFYVINLYSIFILIIFY